MFLSEEDLKERAIANVRKLIEPALPIIVKTYEDPLPEIKQPAPVAPPPQDEDSNSDSDPHETSYTLFNLYSSDLQIFRKWRQPCNTRNNLRFFASNFFDRCTRQALLYEGQIAEDVLTFRSDYDSANLLAVFKGGEDIYDLVMQNDTNSSGYTQWFNFSVSNGEKRGSVTFRVLNFYKKESLFGAGMKPITKSSFDKGWKRNCHKVEYFIDQLQMEGRKQKYYKTLSFRYDFLHANDTVQFCPCLPYPYETLAAFVKNLSSSKLRVKYLAASPLKKILTMLHISAEPNDDKNPRKAIVIMARQHAGETPSSYIVQYMVEELLGSTQENDFLLSKYDFYIFPMVNVDGVAVGNYRCNLSGLDLNRNWHQEDPKELPEIYHIKSELRKIMKKQSVEVLLDLHGHSNKLNSFFYGNTFGKNNMIFPLVASKLEPFIEFGSCSFSDDETEKSKTARVVLGNMIRQTGSAYTYEVSLFGGLKNGRKVGFMQENYQDLAKSLVMALYKSYLQVYKEEKSLKESLYLREIRKELKRVVPKLQKGGSGSDDEASKTTQIEEKAKEATRRKMSIKKEQQVDRSQEQRTEKITVDAQSQTDFAWFEQEYKLLRPINATLRRKKDREQMLREKEMQKEKEKEREMQREKICLSTGRMTGEESVRKKYLMDKLRIFGETFVQESFVIKGDQSCPSDKETQTNLSFRFKDSKLKAYEGLSLTNHREGLEANPYFYGTSNLSSLRSDSRKRSFRLSKSNTTTRPISSDLLDGLIRANKIPM